MGSPKFPKKKYNTPLHPWKENRIESERELIKKYGLKNHKEVWKAKTYLERYRHQARELLAKIGGKDPQVKKESEQLLLHLTRMGILPAGSSLDDVLALETESVLSRRLQTLVFLKGFSSTTNQSRQLINHGHIAIEDRKITIPSYIVSKDEEKDINYTDRSPLTELSHPARPKSDVTSYKTEEIVKPKEEPEVKKEKAEEKEEKTIEPTKEKKEKPEEEKTKDKTEVKKEAIEQEKKPEEADKEKPEEEKSPPNDQQAELKDENKKTDEKKEDK